MSEDPSRTDKEKGRAADLPFTPEGRALSREGGSARARFYRKKDELLNWTMDQVRAFSRESPSEFAPMLEVFVKIREPMLEVFVKIREMKNRLDGDSGDEAALSEATLLMESLRKLVDQSGLRDVKIPSEEPTGEDITTS